MSDNTENAERDRLVEKVVEYQKLMFQSMQGAKMPDWLGSDMTMPQFKILFLLYTRGRMRMSTIADELSKNISTATGVIDRLVEHRLVRREEDPEDRRVVIVRLTEEGTKLCESFLQAGWEQVPHMLARLSLEELQQVELGLRLMSRVALSYALERATDGKRGQAEYRSVSKN